MARTLDHISAKGGDAGRFIFGTGSGWFERDYDEYGYEFGTVGSRLDDLAEALPRVKDRWAKLNPGPTREIPIMIGGKGEQKTLRLVAEHAHIWHSFVRPDDLGRKLDVLKGWGEKVGRDVSDITVSNELPRHSLDDGYADALYDAGVRLFTLGISGPDYDDAAVKHWLAWRDRRNEVAGVRAA
jgi:alkanesulfonate monooxygenase SsuD/methylene tetrahydromethanopterin reductase-like flavin-dependent oxidoreductase (luciferase family)